jgi:ArsR family transcriptional regulator
MRLIEIYQCLCDETRLRILHLLTRGPLCVCHFQSVLGISQTRVSQHLAYLRKRGLVECSRRGTWMIYRLPNNPSPELEKHLRCLQDCVQSDQMFRADLEKLRATTTPENQSPAPKSSCDC